MSPSPDDHAATATRLFAVEPFSVTGLGGGPRIMRSLLTDPPRPVLAVATSPARSVPVDAAEAVPEIHLPVRRYLGRIESTRVATTLGSLDRLLITRFANRLERLAAGRLSAFHDTRAWGLHAVPHSLDFAAVHRVSRRLRLPMFLSLHDDPGYALRGRPERAYALRCLSAAWHDSRDRFVISEEMGIEMCSRYGEQSYTIVTDGLESVASAPRPAVAGRLAVYFMGAAHISYANNFSCLFQALAQLRDDGLDARLITRAGHLPFAVQSFNVPIESRPWAPQTAVTGDLDDVDIAYMPLPFGPEHAKFVRLSLSTKMVTYLGSGVPILLHGPAPSAAGTMLGHADAALVAESLDARSVAEALSASGDRRGAIAANALRLAHGRFLLSNIRPRFWNPILEAAEQADHARTRHESLVVPAGSSMGLKERRGG
jgi:hypothetical protein